MKKESDERLLRHRTIHIQRVAALMKKGHFEMRPEEPAM